MGSPLASVMVPVHWLDTCSVELTPPIGGIVGDALACTPSADVPNSISPTRVKGLFFIGLKIGFVNDNKVCTVSFVQR